LRDAARLDEIRELAVTALERNRGAAGATVEMMKELLGLS
jgi:hypothetical protein